MRPKLKYNKINNNNKKKRSNKVFEAKMFWAL